MKKLLLLSLILFGAVNFGYSQNLETGINFYEEGDYERAIRIFNGINDEPLARLFAGKSYFGMGNYHQAKNELSKVDSTAIEVYREAQYTRALADFQLKNFTEALEGLYRIKDDGLRGSTGHTAQGFYDDLLTYLTLDQRFDAFKATKHDEIRFDLVEAAVGQVEYASAKSLYKAYQNAATTQVDSSRISELEESLNDSLGYWERYNPNFYPDAPSGISYNIGVAIPEFDYESSEFEISQNIYFGIQLAIENFNSENADKKAFISFRNTSGGITEAASVVNDLVWNDDVDAILGPLFSDVAVQFSKYSEMYEIPLLTPLANSDTLNLDLSYTFQLNPTFSIHGKKAAQFAVREMGFDTLAVIAEKGSLGEASALAFRDEAREMGAEVVHYFVKDLESQGYDISEYTEYFHPEDTVYNYNIDAIYAPFTGDVATTLINSLLTHLEAMQSPMAIFGSEEWERVNLESIRLPRSNIFYTQSFTATTGTDIENFNSSFRMRFDVEPDYYAYVGYDAANVLLETLKKVKNPAYLKEGLKKLNNYQGLLTEVSFRGTHINQEVKVKSLSQ